MAVDAAQMQAQPDVSVNGTGGQATAQATVSQVTTTVAAAPDQATATAAVDNAVTTIVANPVTQEALAALRAELLQEVGVVKQQANTYIAQNPTTVLKWLGIAASTLVLIGVACFVVILIAALRGNLIAEGYMAEIGKNAGIAALALLAAVGLYQTPPVRH